MGEFWAQAAEPGLARNAVLMSVLAGVACGTVGTYVVARRITYLAAAIAHSVLAGLGAARYLNAVHGWGWLQPEMGAFAAAVLSALVVGWVTLRGSEREDTVIGAVWAVGMAAGIVFIHATPGYHEDLMSYLFGNILLVSGGDLLLTAVLDAVVVGVILLSHDKLRAVCFDEEFARVRNVHVEGYFMLLLALTAVTVVLLAMMVGVVMVIALLTLPAAIAARAMGSLGAMMLAAAAIAIVFNLAGLTISYTPDLPAGATIILVAGVAYFLSILGGWLWQRRAARRGAEHAGGT